MVNIKNYISEKILKYDSEIDVRPGSNFYSFFIGPLSSILEPFNTEFQKILSDLSFGDISNMSTSTVDRIAQNYLITRRSGLKSTGSVYFYFSDPKRFVLPTGSIITAENLNFEVLGSVNMSISQMEVLLDEYPYYVVGPVAVQAVDYGSQYNVKENTTFRISTFSSASPTKIINKQVFSGGTDTESNSVLFNRIQRSLYGKSLSSPLAIKNIIQDYYPTIKYIEVIGAGHDLMIRDLVTNNNETETIADFLYAYTGLHSNTNDCKHIALKGNFAHLNSEDIVADFPSVFSLSEEFTNEEYVGIKTLEDSLYTEQKFKTIIDQVYSTVSGVNNLQQDLMLYLNTDEWQVHDGTNTEYAQSLYFLSEISKVSDGIKFGLTDAKASIAGKYDALKSFYDSYLAISGVSQYGLSDIKNRYENLLASLRTLVDPKLLNNCSPIYSHPLSQHTGIQIECTMQTTDNTENGEMCYITVLRNDKIFLAHDGYGLAWRKQPELLQRMRKGAGGYTTVDDKNKDKTIFNEEYYDLTSQDSGLFEKCLGDGMLDHPEVWKYNIYLVDNDILNEETWIGHDTIVNFANNKNQFLATGKAWIEPNKAYTFTSKIYEFLGFEAWVFPEGDKTELTDENRILRRGTTYPNYLPISGEKIVSSETIERLNSTKGHFGIGIGETRNCEWLLKNIHIFSFIEVFPAHLFKFKVVGVFNASLPIEVFYYGVGYESEKALLNLTSSEYCGTKLGAYNVTEGVWETLGSHQKLLPESGETDIMSLELSGELSAWNDYVDSEGYINICAIASNLSQDNTLRTLRSYYIQLNNGNTEGYHIGNCTDIYCYDPNNIVTGAVTCTIEGSYIDTKSIMGIDGYIQEILSINDAISGEPFDTATYQIFNLERGLSYSNSANFRIAFTSDVTGTQIQIVYSYWYLGTEVSRLLLSSEDRYPSANFMVKTTPPTIIKIGSLFYSGDKDEEYMKTKVVEFFHKSDIQTFDKSDIVNLFYINGANFVNMDMDIQIIEYDTIMNKNTIDMTAQTYTIPISNLSRFYTHINYLSGVTRV